MHRGSPPKVRTSALANLFMRPGGAQAPPGQGWCGSLMSVAVTAAGKSKRLEWQQPEPTSIFHLSTPSAWALE
ncbi:MAG: hypothetical protein EBT56_16450 [Betaproteobacteria bacterium]|nr:hypothetical protein [Betaproteobacteria bacterium]